MTMKEAEEKIPVFNPPTEVFFVVDCPSLHIITHHQLHSLGPRRQSVVPSTGLWEFERSPSYCPACGRRTSSTRQIPSLCFGSDVPPSNKSNVTLTPPLPLGHLSPASTTDSGRFSPQPIYDRTPTPSDTYSQLQHSPPIENVPVADFYAQTSSLPEHVSSLAIIDRGLDHDIPDPRPDRAPSDPSASKPKGGIFNLKWPSKARNRQNSKESKPKSTYSHDSTGSTLPKFLSFTFSLTGKNLLIWKKSSEAIVRVELESNGGGRLINLGALLPGGVGGVGGVNGVGGVGGGDKCVNIRFVVEGHEWIAAILSHNVGHNTRLSLLVLHCSGLEEHSSLHSLDELQEPKCLAMSPDSNYVAIGFGTKIMLLNYQGSDLRWSETWQVPDFSVASSVRFQALSFAADSSCLAVSTQKRDINRSDEDDKDGQGLTSIHFHPSLSIGLITGLTSTPYSLFLSPTDQQLPVTPTTISDFRIRCCCASPAPNTHILYFMDARNKVFQVNLQAQSIKLISDLNTTRGALKPQEESAALSVSADGQLRVFWRQGPGLWCVDVRERIAPQKTNLRSIWEDVVGDG